MDVPAQTGKNYGIRVLSYGYRNHWPCIRIKLIRSNIKYTRMGWKMQNDVINWARFWLCGLLLGPHFLARLLDTPDPVLHIWIKAWPDIFQTKGCIHLQLCWIKLDKGPLSLLESPNPKFSYSRADFLASLPPPRRRSFTKDSNRHTHTHFYMSLSNWPTASAWNHGPSSALTLPMDRR